MKDGLKNTNGADNPMLPAVVDRATWQVRIDPWPGAACAWFTAAARWGSSGYSRTPPSRRAGRSSVSCPRRCCRRKSARSGRPTCASWGPCTSARRSWPTSRAASSPSPEATARWRSSWRFFPRPSSPLLRHPPQRRAREALRGRLVQPRPAARTDDPFHEEHRRAAARGVPLARPGRPTYPALGTVEIRCGYSCRVEYHYPWSTRISVHR
jgi:hypothetical protein